MTVLSKIQNWYTSQCDGGWEHGFGISITTIDNPGWRIKIQLAGTSLEALEFPLEKIERSEHDWMHIFIREQTFHLACGPKNLEEGLEHFCKWAEI